ncbi:MAG TPA: hypothetical protein VGD10_04670 [Allosphingosinicella sp.]|uniref:hypothetical protein n=1 Tax=Allosphingosinicella sp. TaxID=2823234 RepID=UPI002ED96395
MLITPAGGWGTRGGKTNPLPTPMVEHERAQFATYGVMLLAPLLAPGVKLRRIADANGLKGILVEHPRAQPTELFFDGDDELVEARNSVPDPEGGAPLPQRFRFSRERMPGPVRWPRRLTLEQKGKPYFDLTLTRFEAAFA